MSPEKTKKKLKTKGSPPPAQLGQQPSQQPQATAPAPTTPPTYPYPPTQPIPQQQQAQVQVQVQSPPPGYQMQQPTAPAGYQTVPPQGQPPATPPIPAQQQTAVSPTAVSPTAASPTGQPAAYPPPYYSEPPTIQPAVPPAAAQPTIGTEKPAKGKKAKAKLKPKSAKKPMYKPPTGRKGEKKYRYVVRVLKGSILPMLFGVMSLSSLYSSVNEFEGYFKFETGYILFGFLLGFISMSIITIVNCRVAVNNPTTGSKMHVAVGLIGILPFVIIVLYVALFDSIAIAWQFAMGFFLSAFFPWMIVLLYEISTKNKFYVVESPEAPLDTRRLVAIPY